MTAYLNWDGSRPAMYAAFDALAAMGEHLRLWVETHGHSEPMAEGQCLITEGVPDQRLLFLLEGTARVVNSEVAGASWEGADPFLAQLGAGAMVGEMAFLDGHPPVASVSAGSHCRLLTVQKDELRAAMATDPALARETYELFARKLACQLREQNAFLHRWSGMAIEPLRQALLAFDHLADEDVTWLTAHGEVRRLEAGELLIRQGEPTWGLHVVLSGSARVDLLQEERSKTVATVQQGEILGEMSLLENDVLASASVAAIGVLVVLSVDKTVLGSALAADAPMGTRFYKAMAILLSHWSRNQLRSDGFKASAGNDASPAAFRRFQRLRQLAGL